MFTGISEQLTKTFKKITGTKFLTSAQIDETLRDIRVALIDADVSIGVITDVQDRLKEEIAGIEVIKTVSPSQMVIKAVYDAMVEILGGDTATSQKEQEASVKSFVTKMERNKTDEITSALFDIEEHEYKKNKIDKKKKKKNKEIGRKDALQKLNQLLLNAQPIGSCDIGSGVDKRLDVGERDQNLIDGYDIRDSNSETKTTGNIAKRENKNEGKHKNELNICLHRADNRPAIIMMVGLQGAGKTTTAAKLALHLRKKHKKIPLLVSLDVYRPAAQLQLENLSKQIAVDSFPILDSKDPIYIAQEVEKHIQNVYYDVVIVDTAGRLNIDEGMMNELIALRDLLSPSEILFVADAMIGQEAVRIIKDFDQGVGVTGIVMTKTDSDSRCGAIISMRYATGKEIKFMGAGEKLNELQQFYPDRIASRILGMGDIVSLVETAMDEIGQDEAQN